MSLRANTQKGFTLIEMLIVLAITVMMASVITISFSNFGSSQALDKDTQTVLEVLNEAHSMAISSKNFSGWGVRVGTSSLTLFQGSYGTQNTVFQLSNYSALSTSSGIGVDILFGNVTGTTAASGTIKIYTKIKPSSSSTITVFSTGAIEKE